MVFLGLLLFLLVQDGPGVSAEEPVSCQAGFPRAAAFTDRDPVNLSIFLPKRIEGLSLNVKVLKRLL